MNDVTRLAIKRAMEAADYGLTQARQEQANALGALERASLRAAQCEHDLELLHMDMEPERFARSAAPRGGHEETPLAMKDTCVYEGCAARATETRHAAFRVFSYLELTSSRGREVEGDLDLCATHAQFIDDGLFEHVSFGGDV